MKVRDNRGSITIFVLVGLLFMSAFLIISYAYNVNKSKVAQEQFNIISEIYSPNKSDEESYTDAYTTLRKKNKQTLTASSENSSTLELTKTFEESFNDWKIYGNSVQDGTPSPSNPVEIQSVGNKTVNLYDINRELTPTGERYIKSKKIQNGYDFEVITLRESGGEAYGYNYTLNITEDMIGRSMSISANITIKGNTLAAVLCDAYKDSTYLRRLGYISSTTTLTFTISDDINKIIIRPVLIYQTNSEIGDTGSITNIMLNFGNTAIEYEPYGKYKIPISITDENGNSTLTNIYLDEPLRKVGDYADYIDFKTGKVVRNVSSFIFGNNLSFNSTKEDRILISNARNLRLKTSNAGMSMIWKYEYPQKNVNTAFLYTGNGYFYWYPDVTVFGVNFGDDNATIKDPKLQEWLAKQSDEIKTVYYVLATPDDSEAISLPELKTYEDYTKIEVLTEVAPSKIEVTYEGYTLE